MKYQETLTKEGNQKRREVFMSDDEMLYIDDCITKLTQNKGEMGDLYTRWEDEEKAYKGDQPILPKRPNTRINIFNANIEGQIAMLLDQNIAISTRGESPSDETFAKWARIGLDWTFRKNHIKKVIDLHERRRLKFGSGIFKVYFDEDAIDGFGLAKICTVPLNRFFIDNKIKDYLRFQEAEYVCEPIRLSKTQFINIYGKDKANTVKYGNIYIEDTTVFDENWTMDDENSATVFQWYERQDEKLRLIEFTSCGLLLFDSHKSGDRKTNQKNKETKIKSYYKFVNEKYPYFFSVMYPEEGQIWGFGDGKLLKPIQDMINDMYDKIRICAKPNLTLFDVNSEVDLDDFDENSLEPRPFMGGQSREPVISVPWGIINESWWRLLASMHEEAQRVTRFSDLMLGQSSARAETATEASIQHQQGNASTNHKKNMLQDTLQEVAEYCLCLMMEFYKGAKAFRIQSDKAEFEWIDFRKLANVPIMKEATESFNKQYMDNNPYGMGTDWEILTDSKGYPLTKRVDLDIEINVGAGLPKNRAFLWQMVERLSHMTILDETTGQVKPVVTYQEMRKFIEDFLNIPLEDTEAMKQNPMMQQAGIPQQQPLMQGGQVMNNPQLPTPSIPQEQANMMVNRGSPPKINPSDFAGGMY
jgi:hypothetical protein